MLTDLVQIRRLGEQKREENSRFRAHLKRHDIAERRLRRLAENVEGEVNCRECGNCCRVATALLIERDIERLTKFLGMKREQFLARYTETTGEGIILKRESTGCTFLIGNECSIYEERPHTCRHFPHLVRGAGSLLSRMWHMPDRATYCPIVYNSLEAFKSEARYTDRG